MKQDNYSEWKRKKEDLEKRLAADPTNLTLGHSLWELLCENPNFDIRSGEWILKCYEQAALNTSEGALMLSRAYYDLYLQSGEVPKPISFTLELVNAIKNAENNYSGQDKDSITWVLAHLQK